MKTLADFKRALTLGSKWETYYHRSFAHMGVGEVVKVKSNGVAFLREGKKEPSWLYFPKASCFKVNASGNAQIYTQENELLLTYTKI